MPNPNKNKSRFWKIEEHHQKLSDKWYKRYDRPSRHAENPNLLPYLMFYIGQMKNIPLTTMFITALILSPHIVSAIQAQQNDSDYALRFKGGDEGEETTTVCIFNPELGLHGYKMHDFTRKNAATENLGHLAEILGCEYTQNPKYGIRGSAQQFKEIENCLRKGIGRSFFGFFETDRQKPIPLVEEIDPEQECSSLKKSPGIKHEL